MGKVLTNVTVTLDDDGNIIGFEQPKKAKAKRKRKKKAPKPPSILSRLCAEERAAKVEIKAAKVKKEVEVAVEKVVSFSDSLLALWNLPTRGEAVMSGDSVSWEVYWNKEEPPPFTPADGSPSITSSEKAMSRGQPVVTIKTYKNRDADLEKLADPERAGQRFSIVLSLPRGRFSGHNQGAWEKQISVVKKVSEQRPRGWFRAEVNGVAAKEAVAATICGLRPRCSAVEAKVPLSCHSKLGELLSEADAAVRAWVTPRKTKLLADIDAEIAAVEASIENAKERQKTLWSSLEQIAQVADERNEEETSDE